MKRNLEALKRIRKFTKLRIKTVNDGVLRAGPDFIRIGASRECNFNCMMCWNYSPLLKEPKSKQWKRIKLESKIVFRVIDEAKEMGCRGLLFSGGGEPFAHPAMFDFLEVAKKKGFRVRIQTNLSLVDNPLRLAELGVDVVAVNLCAATPKTYLRVHPNQKKANFNRILDKLQVLIDNVDPDVEVRMTNIITKINYKEILKMIDLSFRMNASLHLELADFSSGRGVEKIAINSQQRQEIIKDLKLLDDKYKEYKKSNLVDFLQQLTYSGIGFEKNTACFMGYLYVFINELGDVYYCNNIQEEFLMGNLNNQSLKDIWLSSKYQTMRKRLYKGDFLSVCQECLKKRGSNFKTRFFVNPILVKKLLKDTLSKIDTDLKYSI